LQAYNLLNHANPVNYTGVQSSPFFATATSALPEAHRDGIEI
jgi:hypothetical protein